MQQQRIDMQTFLMLPFDSLPDMDTKIMYLYHTIRLYTQDEVQFIFNVLQTPKAVQTKELIEYLAQIVRRVANNKSITKQTQTKLLVLIQQMLNNVVDLSDLHIAYLEICISTLNYKLALQQIKLIGYQQSNKLSEYFYLCGIVYYAYRDYIEALRYFSLSNTISQNPLYQHESIKMKMLIEHRLAEKSTTKSQVHSPKLEFLEITLNNQLKQQKDIEINTDLMHTPMKYIDADISLVLEECQNIELVQVLKQKSKTYLKLPFNDLGDLILNQNRLIDILLEVNQMHDLFWINEQEKYIEFKVEKHNMKELIRKLESRFDLVSTLAK